MAYIPIVRTHRQWMDSNGDPYSGAVLKAYAEGTSTNISFATDNTGNTLVSDIVLNASGYPEVSGNPVIPHIDQNYKLALYPTQAAADANSGAIWTIDNINFNIGYDFGSNELTNVGDGTARTSAINVSQVQDGDFIDLGTTGGSADAYTLSPTPAITSYADTMFIIAKIHATNLTTTPYLQISGIASPSTTAVIKKLGGDKSEIAVEIGDMLINGIYMFKRSSASTSVILMNPEKPYIQHQNLLGLSGAVMAFAMETPPSGWLECDGSAISRTTYAALFTAIGTVFGVGDGSTTFNIPDLRGEFIRGWDNGAGNDPDAGSRTDSGDGSTTGDNVGTKQADAFQGHYHNMECNNNNGTAGGGGSYTTQTANVTRTDLTTAPITDGSNGTPRTTSETRPTNVYMMYCIKY